ncbi:MAG: ABC transporter substrate-binding protein [Acidimicrobiales bacterium]
MVARRLVIGRALLALLAVTACSSYERTHVVGSGTDTGAVNGGSGASAGTGAGTGGGSGSGTVQQGQSSASGSAPGGSSLAGGSGPAVSDVALPGGSSAAGGDKGTAGTGGSAKKCTVKVGVTYSSDVSAALAGAGDPAAATRYGGYVKALQAQYQAGADAMNRNGGLAGCQIQLVYYDFRSLSSDGFDAESQRECTALAQDQHVALAFIYGLETKVIIDCLAKNKIPVFYHGGEYTVPNDRDYRQYHGYLYQETGLATDRWGPFIDDLAGAGYFDPGSKVGILLADDGNGNNQQLVNDVWKPRLAALGYTNPLVFTFTKLQSYAAIGDTQAQFSSAVLKFKTAGVNHIIETPDSGNVTLFFPQQAESQDYHPRYALTTPNYPALMADVPADQSARSMAVSYSFFGDTSNPKQMASNPPDSARVQCEALYKGKTNGGLAPYVYCDFMNVVGGALRHAPRVDAQTLLAGVESLGTSIVGAANYGDTRFGPGRYDGGTDVRVTEWDPSIKDYRYVTGVLNVP